MRNETASIRQNWLLTLFTRSGQGFENNHHPGSLAFACHILLSRRSAASCIHSDSLDTLLYARFYHSEPRVLRMETKKSSMGTFPWSHDHDSCTMAFGNTLLYVWEKKHVESLSHPELEPFQKFIIPFENLQFHWKYVSLWEGLSEHGGLSPLRGPSAERSAVCSQALCVLSGQASANFERPSLW